MINILKLKKISVKIVSIIITCAFLTDSISSAQILTHVHADNHHLAASSMFNGIMNDLSIQQADRSYVSKRLFTEISLVVDMAMKGLTSTDKAFAKYRSFVNINASMAEHYSSDSSYRKLVEVVRNPKLLSDGRIKFNIRVSNGDSSQEYKIITSGLSIAECMDPSNLSIEKETRPARQTKTARKKYPLSPDPETVVESMQAFGYEDTEENFNGVDLEHFVSAQIVLKAGLKEDVLRKLLAALGLDGTLSGDGAKEAVYRELAKGKYTKQVIDIINEFDPVTGEGTYEDPRLNITLSHQSGSPRLQGIYEAISNGIDALDTSGLNIGQFAKGVKQILECLGSTGCDRVDVFTAKEKAGTAYHLAIIRTKQGQLFIQVSEISLEKFTDLSRVECGTPLVHGTILKVSTNKIMPKYQDENQDENIMTQSGIVNGIRERYPFVTTVDIYTKCEDEEWVKINGHHTKESIVPFHEEIPKPENGDKNIYVSLGRNSVTIADSGIGMGAETVSKMFVPEEGGTKEPAFLSGSEAKKYLGNIRVVYDMALPRGISFARNREVIETARISDNINSASVIEHGLMVDLGLLLDVLDSRDKISVYPDTDKEAAAENDMPNFQLAMTYALSEIARCEEMNIVDRLIYINSIAAGLDRITGGNEQVEMVADEILKETRENISPLLKKAKENGYIILPHERSFDKLSIPEGKKPLYLHPKLFDWRGFENLRELGGLKIADIKVSGSKKLDLIAVPFKGEALNSLDGLQNTLNALKNGDKLSAVLLTDSLIAIPLQLGKLFYSLNIKKAEGLTEIEQTLFKICQETINVVTAAEVATSYKNGDVPVNMTVEEIKFAESSGEFDSDIINSFLRNPPYVSGTGIRMSQIPGAACIRHILLNDNTVIDLESGLVVLEDIKKFEHIKGKFYSFETTVFPREGIVELDGNASPEYSFRLIGTKLKNRISPDSRYAYQFNETEQNVFENLLIDLSDNGKKYYFTPNGLRKNPDNSIKSVSNVLFSRDGKYIAYMLRSNTPDSPLEYVVVDANTRIPLPQRFVNADDYKFAMDPFADMLYFINITTGFIGVYDMEKDVYNPDVYIAARTNSTGTYTALVDSGGNLSFYDHRTQMRIDSINGTAILNLVTFYMDDGSFIDAAVDARGDVWYWDLNGDLSPATISYKDAEDCEIVDSMGVEFVYGRERIKMLFKEQDPFQRVIKPNVYKHMHTNLIIDSRDQAQPVAIDPATGNEFTFSGEILGTAEIFGNELVYYWEGTILWKMADNAWISSKAAIDNGPRHTVFCATQGTTALRIYHIESGRIVPGEIIDIPYKPYAYDGKYFILIDPDTGDAAYVDPEDAEHPVFVPRVGKKAITFFKPVSAVNDNVIGVGNNGGFAVCEMKKGGGYFYGFDSINRINRYFFAVRKGKKAELYNIDCPPNVIETNWIIDGPKKEQGVIRQIKGDLVLIDWPKAGEQAVFDANNRLYYPAQGFFSQRSYISASGRFSVHNNKQGKLVYYFDHSQNDPQPVFIDAKNVSELYVHEKGDVVIFKHTNGNYSVYDLNAGKWAFQGSENVLHAEIDSTGTFLIGKFADGLVVRNIKKEGIITLGPVERVNISHDNNFVYLTHSLRLRAGEAYWVFDRNGKSLYSDFGGPNGITVAPGRHEEEFILQPRFWECYDAEKKMIRDADKNANAIKQNSFAAAAQSAGGQDAELLFSENPPTNPEYIMELEENGARLVNKSGQTRYFYFDKDENVLELSYFCDDVDNKKTLPMKGGKVWYTVDKRTGELTDYVILDGIGDVRQGNSSTLRINQSKTAIFDNGAVVFRDGTKVDLSSDIAAGHRLTDTNGDCFVFFNPDTEDVMFLEPARIRKPSFVLPAPKKKDQAVYDTKPSDAPHDFNAVKNPDGTFSVRHAETGKEHPIRWKEVFRLYEDTFVCIGDISSVTTYGMNAGSPNAVNITLLDKNRIEMLRKSRTKPEIGLNISRLFWNINSNDTKRFDVSASGRFCVIGKTDGIVVYADMKEQNPSYKEIVKKGDKIKGYNMTERADAVFLRTASGAIKIFNLKTGEMLEKQFDFDRAFVDSSGHFLIGIFKNDIYTYHIGTNFRMDAHRYAETAFDGKYLYSKSVYNNGGYELNVFDHKGKKLSQSESAALPLPRFWEKYGRDNKIIWDADKQEDAFKGIGTDPTFGDYMIDYGSPGANLTDKAIELFGSTCVIRSSGWSAAFNLAAAGRPNTSQMHFGQDKFSYLPGGNILFNNKKGASCVIQAKDSINAVVAPEMLINDCDDKVILLDGQKLYFATGEDADIGNSVGGDYKATDVNGRYFVFTNMKTGEIKYLDPEVFAAKKAMGGQAQQITEDGQKLWNEKVILRRDEFIAAARSGYMPLLELVPDSFRGAVENTVKMFVEKMYKEEEEEIVKRFKGLLSGGEADLDNPPLPFDEYVKKMRFLTDKVRQYLTPGRIKELSKIYDTRELEFYFTFLFEKLIFMCMNENYDIRAKNFEPEYCDTLAMNWTVASEKEYDRLPFIALLVSEMKNLPSKKDRPKMKQIVKTMAVLSEISGISPEKHEIVISQIKRILKWSPEDSEEDPGNGRKITPQGKKAKHEMLSELCRAFKKADMDALLNAVKDPKGYQELGLAKKFIIFLTHDIKPLKTRQGPEYEGREIDMPKNGVSVTQIARLEKARKKKGKEDDIMDIEYLLDHIGDLPDASEDREKKILKDIKGQREAGAYAAEIAQNSRDAVKGKHGELVVDFYIQKGKDGDEYVEEASDNGTGALKEAALLIPKSTKSKSGQVDLAGYFGTGKYTIFQGVDRVEIISNNGNRAFLFGFHVYRDSANNPVSLKLTRICKLDPGQSSAGVTIRRIKNAEGTIPELDRMIAEQSWKTFAGMSQFEQNNSSFRIFFKDDENNKQKLEVFFKDRNGNRRPIDTLKDAIAEMDLRAKRPDEKRARNFGKVRIYQTEDDMPLQIIDAAGLRVRGAESDDRYFELIPPQLKHLLKELGCVIQIPLPLIRNRSNFRYEDDYLAAIQKHVAAAFYKALAFKALTQANPQFVFENFMRDWETNEQESYWRALAGDKDAIRIADAINKNDMALITKNDLLLLCKEEGKLDREKKSLKLILQLNIETGKEKKESMVLRRIAVLTEKREKEKKARIKWLRKQGISVSDDGYMPEKDVPYFHEKLRQSRSIATAHEQMAHIDDYIVPPDSYDPREEKLVHMAEPIAKYFGLKEVYLAGEYHGPDKERTGEFPVFAGGFTHLNKKPIMVLNRTIAYRMGKAWGPFMDEAANTIIHELAHLVEDMIRNECNKTSFEQGYVKHELWFTHDSVGTFAEAMKYVAAVWLMILNKENGSAVSEEDIMDYLAKNGPMASIDPALFPGDDTRKKEKRARLTGEKELKQIPLLLSRASKALKGYPVDMEIDLSLIPDGDLDENMYTWAYIMALHNNYGLDMRYIFKSGAKEKESAAVKSLYASLDRMAGEKNIIAADLKDKINKPHDDPKTIKVSIMAQEDLMNLKSLAENMLPVAMTFGEDAEGSPLMDFASASAIGIVQACVKKMTTESDPDTMRFIEQDALRILRGLYKRIFPDDKIEDVITIETILKMAGSNPIVRKKIAIDLALPPIMRAAVQSLAVYHERIREILSAA